jgi:urease accessory protein
MLTKLTLAALALTATAAPAFAHLDPVEHGSFMAGVSHPLFGADHILAMVAVGLWAALLGKGSDRRALWLVPSAFVATMAVGFAAALGGVTLPFVEPVILASVVVIGLLAAMAIDVRAPLAMALVGFFAVFHGHAHGGELGTAGALQFGLGFALSTALLHVAGMGLGLSLGSRTVARIAGGATAIGGLVLALG